MFFLLQCTLYNSIHYYLILATIQAQFKVPAFLYGISKGIFRSTFYALFKQEISKNVYVFRVLCVKVATTYNEMTLYKKHVIG